MVWKKVDVNAFIISSIHLKIWRKAIKAAIPIAGNWAKLKFDIFHRIISLC
jgi:hypothetical protein